MPKRTGMVSVVGFLAVLEFASGMSQAWRSPLLPGLLRHYGTTAAELNWVNAVYLLSTAVCVPLLAKLGDRYGHRRLLIVAASLVAIGSSWWRWLRRSGSCCWAGLRLGEQGRCRSRSCSPLMIVSA